MRLDDREREHDQGNEISGPEEWVTGWPAIVTSVQRSFVAMGAVRAVRALAVINQPSGFDCPGCAWPEAPPGARHRVEFCESGAKAVAEDATAARIDAAFFARHSLDDLRTRSDYWLGQAGRLTHHFSRLTCRPLPLMHHLLPLTSRTLALISIAGGTVI